MESQCTTIESCNARHENLTIEMQRMEDKIDKIIDVLADLKVCIARQEEATKQNTNSLMAHMVAEEKTLDNIGKSVDRKVDSDYLAAIVAIAIVFGSGVIGVAIYLFTQIQDLQAQVGELPQQIVKEIEQKYFISK